MTIKTFRTLAVASAATGVGLCDGISYSDMMEIWSHAIGFPVWTHEMADRALSSRMHAILLGQFPLLPTADEAHADWQAAAMKASAAYGETVALPEGNETRTEGPVATLARLIDPDKIVVVSLGA